MLEFEEKMKQALIVGSVAGTLAVLLLVLLCDERLIGPKMYLIVPLLMLSWFLEFFIINVYFPLVTLHTKFVSLFPKWIQERIDGVPENDPRWQNQQQGSKSNLLAVTSSPSSPHDPLRKSVVENNSNNAAMYATGRPNAASSIGGNGGGDNTSSPRSTPHSAESSINQAATTSSMQQQQQEQQQRRVHDDPEQPAKSSRPPSPPSVIMSQHHDVHPGARVAPSDDGQSVQSMSEAPPI
jgi:hypothetical protein